jgi:hypothetical protein
MFLFAKNALPAKRTLGGPLGVSGEPEHVKS